jgi:shikimate kinase/3-dehydroquinate synthase
MKKIICLVGLMGVGKTTFGQKLAKNLSYYFIDTDKEIEDLEGLTISEIFKKKGEKYFREVEKKLISEIVKRDENIVLSTGGGCYATQENRDILKEKAIIIWLKAPISIILQRINQKKNRPLLNGKDKKKVLEELEKKRSPYYSQCDIIFDTQNDNFENILKKIFNLMTNYDYNQTLEVKLPDKAYQIIVREGAVSELAEFIIKKKYSKIILIIDENVAKFHLNYLKKYLQNLSISSEEIIIKSGEESKSFDIFQKTAEEILSKQIDRKSALIAFGGGVVGDLSGFIASVLLRGIEFIQVPTTLLAMVDSSVGGKTAINSQFGKNLIGTFYQPSLVICDLNFLTTLPIREIKAGYAEIVKYGLIRDRDFFDYLDQNYQKIFVRDLEILKKIIIKSCEIKAEIVSLDEKENNQRALLNFGHTFGHIFETECNYSNELLHGEAVSIGILMAAKMSFNLQMISFDEFVKIKNHFEKSDLIYDPKKIRKIWQTENLINHLYKDKKTENGNLTFILLEKIGSGKILKSVDLSSFTRVLDEFIK